MRYSTTEFFDYLYVNRCGKEMNDRKENIDTLEEENIESNVYIGKEERINRKRSQLIDILGINRLKELSSHKDEYLSLISEDEYDTYQLKRYEYELLPKLRIPIFLLEPKVWNGKSVLYNHGHDEYGAKGSFIDYGQENPYHKWLPLKLVSHGYKVVVPEYIGFGEVKKEDHIQEAERGCYINSELLLMYGLNMAGLRVFEAKSILTIMINQWELSNVTVCGTSGGGLVTAFLSAIDHRMRGNVVYNYGASFKSSIMAMHHCVDNYIPRILEVGEIWDVLSLIAPTPLLFSTGINDRIFPYEGAQQTVDKLKDILGTNHDKWLQTEFFEGGHEIFLGKIFEFLQEIV